jgi:hypothetical protein
MHHNTCTTTKCQRANDWYTSTRQHDSEKDEEPQQQWDTTETEETHTKRRDNGTRARPVLVSGVAVTMGLTSHNKLAFEWR